MLRSMLRLLKRRERGQVLILVAGLAPVLLGMTGMAIDIGSYAGHRRELQNSADAIALAAAQRLCETSCSDTTEATEAANQWAEKNDIDLADLTLTFSGGSSAPRVRASIQNNHNFAFMRIVGIDSRDVGAAAASIKVSFGGGNGIVPWAVTQDTIDAAGSGNLVTMKYDATGGNLGNFGAIRIDGPGANTYGTSARYGSQDYACAEGTANCTTGACPGTYPATCAENSPTCDGPECTPETGNVIGPTREAVDFRMNNTSATCDTFAETFTLLSTGKYHLEANCNPWTDGPGECTSNAVGFLCSRRVIVIPVVDEFGNGASDPLTIQRFALMYLEGYEGTCTGNDCEIRGRFVQADLNARAFAGAFDPEASIHFVKLVE